MPDRRYLQLPLWTRCSMKRILIFSPLLVAFLMTLGLRLTAGMDKSGFTDWPVVLPAGTNNPLDWLLTMLVYFVVPCYLFLLPFYCVSGFIRFIYAKAPLVNFIVNAGLFFGSFCIWFAAIPSGTAAAYLIRSISDPIFAEGSRLTIFLWILDLLAIQAVFLETHLSILSYRGQYEKINSLAGFTVRFALYAMSIAIAALFYIA